jgi:hypothetical protein
MNFGDSELMFPARVISALRDLRGDQWRSLVDGVREQPEAAGLERLAFVLLMVRLLSCQSCQANSFRALRGCEACASNAVRRYQGSDCELILKFYEAREDVRQFTERDDSKLTRKNILRIK